MNKKLKLIIGIVFALISSSHADPVIYQTPYNSDQCAQGTAGRWTGACACYDSTKTAGRYCDEPVGVPCDTNSQCQSDEFCFYPPKELAGVCHKIFHYPAITKGWWLWKKSYILSGELMNWPSAQSFCAALDGRIITRADFKCHSMGASCLNLDLLTLLKPAKGLGFFWLDEDEEKPGMAYYADFNDGIVYNFKKSSAAVTQALCLVGEKR